MYSKHPVILHKLAVGMRNRPWEEKWAIQEAKAGSKGKGLWSSYIARKNIEKDVRGIKG